MAPSKAPLRLLAEDTYDLAVISAALQDAVCQIGDIAYQASARQLTVALNRYRWENGARTQERVRTGLQFGGVMAVKTRNLRRDANDAVKKAVKDKLGSEDDQKRSEADIQKVTDRHIGVIDQLVAAKEQDIMAV